MHFVGLYCIIIQNTLPIAIMPSFWITSDFLHRIRSPSSSTMTPHFVPDSEDSMLSGYLKGNLETTSGKRNKGPSGTT